MGLADELKTLQELHEKGKLTDQEYGDAKAAVLKKQEPVSGSRRLGRFVGSRIIPLLVVLLVLLGYIWYRAGTRTTTQMIATAVHAPVTLTDEVQNLPASSWKAVALNLPYSGTVEVSLQVVRGNPVDVFLTTPDQFETMKKGERSMAISTR